MIKKLSELASVQSGVVLGRKEAPSGSDSFVYQRLSLRALNETGRLNHADLEPFNAQEALLPSQITQANDIVVRLFEPLLPMVITDSDVGIAVPSQLAIIRLHDQSVLPAYLQLLLSRKDIYKEIFQRNSSSQRAITISSLMKLELPIAPIEIQQKAVQLRELTEHRLQLYQNLIEQEQLLAETLIENMIGGAKP